MTASMSVLPLFSLPRELRDQIYEYLFALSFPNSTGQVFKEPLLLNVSSHFPYSALGVPTSGTPFSMLAPLCKACQQLYQEATPLYLSSCILSIEDIITTKFVLNWLKSFGDEGFKAVRHLEFADFNPVEDDNEHDQHSGLMESNNGYGSPDHNLLARCPNLRSLTLTFRNTPSLTAPTLLHQQSGFPNFFARPDLLVTADTVSCLVQMYRLDSILTWLKKLEDLQIRFPDEKRVVVRQQVCLEMRRWFLKGFEEMGKWVDVECGFEEVDAQLG